MERLCDYLGPSLSTFMNDLTDKILCEFKWSEIALCERFAPFLAENLFYDNYNGVIDFDD